MTACRSHRGPRLLTATLYHDPSRLYDTQIRFSGTTTTLNILKTGNSEDKVNGILFSTDADDIDALAEREYGYDLLPVVYERLGAQSVAYMFIARAESHTIGHRVLEEILPNESSLSICLTGAATYGAAFMETWIESCLLASKTPLIDDPFYAALIEKTLRTLDIRG
jgi:hypothetical protein